MLSRPINAATRWPSRTCRNRMVSRKLSWKIFTFTGATFCPRDSSFRSSGGTMKQQPQGNRASIGFNIFPSRVLTNWHNRQRPSQIGKQPDQQSHQLSIVKFTIIQSELQLENRERPRAAPVNRERNPSSMASAPPCYYARFKPPRSRRRQVTEAHRGREHVFRRRRPFGVPPR